MGKLKKLKPMAAPTPPKVEDISVIRTDTVPIVQLKMFGKNPNRGDTATIMESIKHNGQFRPVVVNIGNYTGKHNEILAGNHTYMAMRKLGREEILASFVDVNEDQARRIVLADNETAAKGNVKDDIVAELLGSLSDYTGTGYTEAEVNAIFADMEKATEEAEERESKVRAEREAAEDDPDYQEPDEYAEGFSDERDDPADEGMAELKKRLPDSEKFRVGYFGIPALREDMLMTPEEMPAKLDSWAGSATANWPDEDQWWLYNWRVDSTSGMRDLSKIIVSFYTWDDHFENWFWYPQKFARKLQKAGVKYLITPNYSLWDNESRFMWLWALYRSRYVGRYMQEAGIKIIPDFLASSDRKFMDEQIIATLPKKCPMLSFQFQTNMDGLLRPDKAGDHAMSDDEIKDFIADWDHVLAKVKPRAILLYTNDDGFEWFKKHVTYKGKVFYVETRMRKLGDYRKLKAKQKTI
ncbi:ParB-like nuclease domain protein [Gordonia phage DalanDe]|nr:ParB-like nuclease domain protein [Gordonia phage DalanDe]